MLLRSVLVLSDRYTLCTELQSTGLCSTLSQYLSYPHCCCALTGNNAVEMQTTAEFDQDADEFIITTPTTLAQKYWVCHPLYSSHSVAVSLSEITLRACSNATSLTPYSACQHNDVYKRSDWAE